MTTKTRVAKVLGAAMFLGAVGAVSAQQMGPGMMGGYGMGPGMMGPGMMGPGMMGHGMMMGPGMMGPGMMGCGMMGPMTGMGGGYGANLSRDQQSKVAEIQSALRAKHWELMAQMQAAQLRFNELYSADKRDSAAIAEQHKAAEQLNRQMWETMADAQRRMDGILTQEQKDALRRWGMRGMMWNH